MANNDIQNEIELLRAQLDEMKREREVEQAATTAELEEQAEEQPKVEAVLDPASATAGVDSAVAESNDLAAQFKELLESIDKDIKDTKPTTLLVVFALGVIVGRL